MKVPLLFALTLLCWGSAIFTGVRGVRSIIDASSTSLAILKAPGETLITVPKAGQITLWHNFEDLFEGETIREDPALPGGYHFQLQAAGDPAPLPFVARTGSTTINGPQTKKRALGHFELSAPGDYGLTVTGPAEQPRLLSLTEGGAMQSFRQIFGYLGGSIALILLGLAFLTIAIILLIIRKKPRTPPLPPHAS
ncbi:hypothetical protein [Roseibacillus ishigakijimensis]|uniref:Uncharacterized protein n=1 Tax=Roseibacillus ishigakijimensis TaxID=454146 RepID=A0A934RUP5_9BACT|nr:hypothetical protein [Roseibacillus ishigakijimensis]MBK1834495.1 hypothetical protein [Roseibacillus ishigakijimensis]